MAQERKAQMERVETDIQSELLNPGDLEKALKRAQAAGWTAEELMESSLPGLLMGEVRPRYSVATKCGRLARRYPI